MVETQIIAQAPPVIAINTGTLGVQMMKSIKRFKLNIDPVAKGRPRFCRRGRFVSTYTPEETLRFENQIKWLSIDYQPMDPITGPVFIDLVFHMPIPASRKKTVHGDNHIVKPDIDNLVKSCIDPLNKIFWVDDSQICRIKASKIYSGLPGIEYCIYYDKTEEEVITMAKGKAPAKGGKGKMKKGC